MPALGAGGPEFKSRRPDHLSSTQSSELQVGDHAPGPARASQRLSICRLNRPVLNRSDVFIRERQRRLLRHGFG
jgi:hypothetical protein